MTTDLPIRFGFNCKNKRQMWLKIQGKSIHFCFFHFISEIIQNTPILLLESWSLKLQGRKKVLRHKALSPDPKGSIYIYIYWMWGSPSIHLRWTSFHSSISNPFQVLTLASISLLPSSPSALMITLLTLILGLFLMIQEGRVEGWPCRLMEGWFDHASLRMTRND